MKGSLILQIHEWPWSFGQKGETDNCPEGLESIPYHGGAVLSCADDAVLRLTGRFESVLPQGPSFLSASGELCLYPTPHALQSTREKGKTGGEDGFVLSLGCESRYYPVAASPDAIEQPGPSDGTAEASDAEHLAALLLSWSQAMDELREAGRMPDSDAGLRLNPTWKDIVSAIDGLQDIGDEPRKSLIVHIAEKLNNSLADTVRSARRLLARERSLQPVGRINELDHACLAWLIRQPGETLKEKAAVNGQNLLGVSRYETFDTLENRVLKDFLRRCVLEAGNYLRVEVGENQRTSERAMNVGSFKHLCTYLLKSEQMEGVSLQRGPVTPNYVLQSDSRYRRIWGLYQRLLRQEDEKDSLWTWQNRTWNEIATLLLNCAIHRVASGESPLRDFDVRPLAKPALHINSEQDLGCRLGGYSVPGPFLVRHRRSSRSWVLELVNSGEVEGHVAGRLGRVGAWQYVCLMPVGRSDEVKVIAVWPVHTASSRRLFDPDAICSSAERALRFHEDVVNSRSDISFLLYGLALCSAPDGDVRIAEGRDVTVTALAPSPKEWKKNLDLLTDTFARLLCMVVVMGRKA